ncbi:MAG: alkaline phosphatase family protein [Deltaproteobacteria bacterium]|nr:alkaline phosphatase family protein [Deltaproteobacteria bacterium]
MSMVNRGSARGKNLTKFSRIWYFYYAHLTDRWAFVDQSASEKLIAGLKRNPDFTFIVFPAVDEYSHRSSPFHPRTVQAYREVDSAIGEVVEKLKRRGEWDETLMVIVSDHGLSDTKTHFDVGPWLDSKGIKAFYYTQIFKRNFKAASMVSGNGMAHLYFKNEKGWTDRTTFEELSHTGILLDELRHQPAVSLVACQGADGAIHLLTEKGHGLFRIADGRVNYQWEKDDPLGVFGGEGQSLAMTPDESVEKTWDSHYPDVFGQLRQLFSSPRTGDVVISANSGFDLRERYEHPEHKASHGAICPEHMRIPFLMNHRLDRRCTRSVDVFPTVLKLMGRQIPDGIDGKSLV